MARKGPMIVASLLLLLMGAAGLLDDLSGLLMVAPFLGLLGLLLLGLYPGEQIIEKLARALRARPWPAMAPGHAIPALRILATASPSFGTGGPRAPPVFG